MLPLQGAWVQFLVGELRSCMPCGMAKKFKKWLLLEGRFEGLLQMGHGPGKENRDLAGAPITCLVSHVPTGPRGHRHLLQPLAPPPLAGHPGQGAPAVGDQQSQSPQILSWRSQSLRKRLSPLCTGAVGWGAGHRRGWQASPSSWGSGGGSQGETQQGSWAQAVLSASWGLFKNTTK